MLGNKLKKLINTEEEKQEGNNKKKIENLVFLVVILIITVVAINAIWNGNSKKNKQDENSQNSKQLAQNMNNTTIETSSNTSKELEKNLETILSRIQGVGEVKVFINYSESSEVVPMYNEASKNSNTEETDTQGGIRKIQEQDSQKEIIYKEENGEKVPITKKIVEPKVQGAIITAKGASDVNIKTSIIQAVEAVTGLATHKIQVFEMN
ncbi:MAG: hypothetical protein ACLTKT_06330 [Clostridia bacterium]|nr:hypothetical protein [Clostridium sp.]MBS6252036.1 hypothetical protein [Clostridium sp.]